MQNHQIIMRGDVVDVSADWNQIKTEYITTDISYRKLAEKYGVNTTTIAKRASREGWQSERQQQANKTLSKMLAADAKCKVDRASRLKTVADKLLDKVERMVEAEGPISASAIKNLSDALKNIRDAQMLRTPEDIEEQKARIQKLRNEAQKVDRDKEITITLEGSLSEYAQ